MEPLHLAFAFVPLALYLLGLGVVYARGRPAVISGTVDVTLLAAALVGFAMVGPMELVMPAAPPLPGPWVWLVMGVVYVLLVTLWNLLAAPRLVVLNATVEQLRPVLAEIAARIAPDAQHHWAGDSLVLEQLGVQCHLDGYRPLRTVSLVANGSQQSESGWQRLRHELQSALAQVEPADRQRGYTMISVALVMLLAPLIELARLGMTTVAQRLNDMLRL